MGINHVGSGLSLLQNLPASISGKLGISFAPSLLEGNRIEVIILTSSNEAEMQEIVSGLGGTYEDLGYGFGIVNIPINSLIALSNVPTIRYIELPKNLFTTDAQSNRASCIIQARDRFDLEGEGVLIGFIDTGIDYTHPGFMNEDGTTRIDYIYDLSLGGAVYDREQINLALQSQDPFSVVPSFDQTGHGTHVAGIACAGGRVSEQYYGVAPRSSIAMVKSTRGQYALSTNIMKGLKFLVDKSKELNKPLVVNISLSTNDGAHNGKSLLEQYISTVATLERITIVIAAGNEGDAAHHIGGELQPQQTIFLNVAGDERAIVFNLYKPILANLSIRIITPTGLNSGDIIVREGYSEGIIGRDRYQIYYTGPKPFDLLGEISIAITTNAQFLSAGQWGIRINLLNQYTGVFDMWLPISEGLNTRTRFLQPTVLNTLGIPATVENVIAVGSYNYITNNISSFSGRGRPAMFQLIRPDLVAPGENISSLAPNRSFDTKTGTSMAAPNVAGIAALMMEWGIIKGNDPFLYGERLKYYLVVSANRPRTDIRYPDPSWGYGEVCLFAAIENIINTLGVRKSR
ncbi:S8 family peptidase [Clostridium isatidis]|uniref:S8 family peptidase n=1 Tax=Clostridium isatidis TaxID=182773 RepID=UPI003AAE84F2